MILLDTDTLTHFFHGRQSVVQKMAQVADDVAISIVTRIELLQGRFDFLLKAADGAQLRDAWMRLAQTERDLDHFWVVSIDEATAKNVRSTAHEQETEKDRSRRFADRL